MALLLLTDRAVYRFYRARRVKPVILVIVSMGVMFILNGLVRFIIGPGDQRFADGERFIINARDFKEMTGLEEGLAIKTTQGITLVTAVIVVAALFWFLGRTRTGKSMRAYSDNEDLALLSGINPERVVTITWLIVAALATVAGRALRARQELQALHLFPAPAADLRLGHRRRARQSAGGHRGRVRHRLFRGDDHLRLEKGAGLRPARELEPSGLVQLLSTDYKFAVSFVILLIVLLFRPTGLFRGKAA